METDETPALPLHNVQALARYVTDLEKRVNATQNLLDDLTARFNDWTDTTS